MIVDSSAIVAIVIRESGWEELVDLIAAAASCGVGAPTLAESGIVLAAKMGPEAGAFVGSRFPPFRTGAHTMDAGYGRSAGIAPGPGGSGG